jgi:hypothetical protein
MSTFKIERVAAYNLEKPMNEPSLVFLNCPASILKSFQNLLEGTPILGATYFNPYTEKEETIPTDIKQLTSYHLQVLARNEHVNVDGRMNLSLYNELLTADQVASLRCLVKATTVSGSVYATHTGGYRHYRHEFEVPIQNILIDQVGLQWQGDYRNTGGLHFYPDDLNHEDLPQEYQQWQNELYETLYGFKRPSSCSDYKIPVEWGHVWGFIDLNSVSNAIALEFSQALDAVAHQGAVDLQDGALINFKFYRAGMGFFSSGLNTKYVHMLRIARLEGIERALEQICSLPKDEIANRLGKISRIVLPYSAEKPYSNAVLTRIGKLVKSLGLQWGGAPEEDAFKPQDGFINAITNCGDPHAMPGNEGGPCSSDACIAFNANINYHIAPYNEVMQLRTAPEFVFNLKTDAEEIEEKEKRLRRTNHFLRPAPAVDDQERAESSKPDNPQSTP